MAQARFRPVEELWTGRHGSAGKLVGTLDWGVGARVRGAQHLEVARIGAGAEPVAFGTTGRPVAWSGEAGR